MTVKGAAGIIGFNHWKYQPSRGFGEFRNEEAFAGCRPAMDYRSAGGSVMIASLVLGVDIAKNALLVMQ